MTKKQETVLKINNVTKSFYLPHHQSESVKDSFMGVFRKKKKSGDVYEALKGVSFTVKKGDFFGVVGRNGAGKSTLLRIMAEIYQPTSGGVLVKGNLVPFIELGIGFNNNLTARQNVYLNGAMLGFSKKDIDERYQTIVDFSELEQFMDQKLKNFSSGMRVRLAFSVAIQADADILLLDEVLAVGDTAFKQKCFDYFETLKNSDKTVIFVSHNMSAVKKYCNKAVLIENGKIELAGTANEVADRYTQLFQKEKPKKKEKKKRENEEVRWGTKRAEIENIEISLKEDKILARAVLKANNEDISSVKFGLTMKDKTGRMIAGFNNKNVQGGKDFSIPADGKVELNFEMDNIFGRRNFSIVATLVSNDNTETYDKWNDIMEFSNEDKGVPYPILLPGKMTSILNK